MNRRRMMLSMLAASWALPSRVWAQSDTDQIVSRLQNLGYTDIRIVRTFLGRIRIIARGPLGEREIVLNPSNGVILRDYTEREDDDGGKGRGRGGDDDRDDDDEDDDDDDDDDQDNSGSGSGSDDDDDDNDDD